MLELAFCKLWLILLTCPSQILLTDTACTLFALGPNEAATLVAKEGVPDHIFQAHRAWRSSQARHAYIERPVANKLLPTRAMYY